MNVLVLYASTHGHTGKIASGVAEAVRSAGAEAEVRKAEPRSDVDPAAYDAVIAGASIHAGRHQQEMVDWARRNATKLTAMPSAFFSVSLSAAEDTQESREANESYLADFEDDTGWTPGRSATFAGALQYREYDFMTRLIMRLMMSRGGHPTDIGRDYDYTDWDAVERFGREFAEQARRGAQP